ncbi:hypothetical protein [Xanthomarina sp.]|nr:hypothetical protein [Xanthomarina sp.]
MAWVSFIKYHNKMVKNSLVSMAGTSWGFANVITILIANDQIK